eukprot:5755038-Amphidinium_carterae.1
MKVDLCQNQQAHPRRGSLPTTRVSHSGFSWNENPCSWNESHSGWSGPVPMAASARPTTVPQSFSQGAPTLADLRKVTTTLPVLRLKEDVPFNLINSGKNGPWLFRPKLLEREISSLLG